MRRLLAAVGACVVAAAAPAADPQPAPVEALISRLGSPSFAEREAATVALAELGPGAIPALEAAAAGPDPEVTRRANLVLAKLRRRADNTFLAARTIRLDYRNTPLGLAAADLRVRTGLPVCLDPDRIADVLRPVTCVAADLPVWEAVAVFCRAAGLREVFLHELPVPRTTIPGNRTYSATPPPPTAEAVPIVLIDGNPIDLPGSRSTAVRVLALPPEFPDHRVLLGTGDTTFCLDVAPTPGLRWKERPAVRVTRVLDDAGREGGAGLRIIGEPEPIPPEQHGPRVGFRTSNLERPSGPAFHPNPRVVRVPLKLATPAAKSLRLLEGAVVGEVVVPGQTVVTIPDPIRALNLPVDGPNGLRVTVTEVRVEADSTVIRVRTEYPSPWLPRRQQAGAGPLWPEPPPAPGMTYQWKAFDAAGRPLPFATPLIPDMHDDGFNMVTVTEVTFGRDAGVPAKLVLVGPRTVVVEVPFRMANVPLP